MDKEIRINRENNAVYDLVSIYTGLSKINSMFGDNVNEDDYLDNALNCLRLIGNVHPLLYGISAESDNEGYVCLPANALSIEAVTNGYFDWSSFSYMGNTSNFNLSGQYIAYEFLGDRIRIEHPNKKVSILYKGYSSDEEGLPLITEAEAEACAYWWVYIDTRRKIRTGNASANNYFQIALSDKNKAINQARVPNKFSQNFLNQYGNVITSFDRKSYNKDYKPIKLQ